MTTESKFSSTNSNAGRGVRPQWVVVYVVVAFLSGRNLQRPSRRETENGPSSLRAEPRDAVAATYRDNVKKRSTVCFTWENGDDADRWWSDHPEYEAVSEDDDGACFAPRPLSVKNSFFKQLYANQQNTSNCDNVHTRHMWSSGWGADIENLAEGLIYGLETERPFQIMLENKDEGEGWHYAAFKEHLRKGRPPVCPTMDMFCYFLPLSPCPPLNLNVEPADPKAIDDNNWMGMYRPWLREYTARPQMWIRKRALDYQQKRGPSKIELPCAVAHVRRADVVLHDEFSRKYFAINDYLETLRKQSVSYKNVLLFTDDANALDEAHKFHPEINWMYLNKTRHRGSSGGWENQIPSDDPADEVAAIFAVLKLAQKCDVIVHGSSSFADAIYYSMASTGREILRLQVDEGDPNILHEKNVESEQELKNRLEESKLSESAEAQ